MPAAKAVPVPAACCWLLQLLTADAESRLVCLQWHAAVERNVDKARMLLARLHGSRLPCCPPVCRLYSTHLQVIPAPQGEWRSAGANHQPPSIVCCRALAKEPTAAGDRASRIAVGVQLRRCTRCAEGIAAAAAAGCWLARPRERAGRREAEERGMRKRGPGRKGLLPVPKTLVAQRAARRAGDQQAGSKYRQRRQAEAAAAAAASTCAAAKKACGARRKQANLRASAGLARSLRGGAPRAAGH